MLPLVAGLASMAGPLLSFAGQRDTNDTNREIASQTSAQNMAEAQRNRDFQASQVAAQMGFQERMANTAHQREMADLKAAGLNPILAANKGADSPSGASAGGSQGSAVSATMQNPMASFSGLITGALEAMQMAGGIDKQKAETDYLRTQNRVAMKGIPRAEISNDIYDLVKPYIDKAKSAFKEWSAQGVRPEHQLNNKKKSWGFPDQKYKQSMP